MGTSLTGTKPKDTYDSLIKVGDNGPISGTAKRLSDGLGNDLPISVSTSNVGIGTSTPSRKLSVQASAATANEQLLYLKQPDDFGFSFNLESASSGNLMIKGVASGTETASIITLRRDNLRVGINNDAPAVPLDVVGNIRSSTGILFGSDTAAANALDDYEEGTWTMGVSFGGGSTGVTYSDRTGTYTKIGRKVTVNGYIYISNKGTSTGNVDITGLPFAQASGTSNFSAGGLYLVNITFANQFTLIGLGGTSLQIYEITEAGAATRLTDADFSNGSEVLISYTYFV